MISIRHLCVILEDPYRHSIEDDDKGQKKIKIKALTNYHVGSQGIVCCLGVQGPVLYAEHRTLPTEHYSHRSQSFPFQARQH